MFNSLFSAAQSVRIAKEDLVLALRVNAAPGGSTPNVVLSTNAGILVFTSGEATGNRKRAGAPCAFGDFVLLPERRDKDNAPVFTSDGELLLDPVVLEHVWDEQVLDPQAERQLREMEQLLVALPPEAQATARMVLDQTRAGLPSHWVRQYQPLDTKVWVEALGLGHNRVSLRVRLYGDQLRKVQEYEGGKRLELLFRATDQAIHLAGLKEAQRRAEDGGLVSNGYLQPLVVQVVDVSFVDTPLASNAYTLQAGVAEAAVEQAKQAVRPRGNPMSQTEIQDRAARVQAFLDKVGGGKKDPAVRNALHNLMQCAQLGDAEGVTNNLQLLYAAAERNEYARTNVERWRESALSRLVEHQAIGAHADTDTDSVVLPEGSQEISWEEFIGQDSWDDQ